MTFNPGAELPAPEPDIDKNAFSLVWSNSIWLIELEVAPRLPLLKNSFPSLRTLVVTLPSASVCCIALPDILNLSTLSSPGLTLRVPSASVTNFTSFLLVSLFLIFILPLSTANILTTS